MIISRLCVLAFSALNLVGAAVSSSRRSSSYASYALKDKRSLPAGWELVKRASPTERVTIRFGLKHGNFAELERRLYQVSDPAHAKYGQHLSAAEVARLSRPSDQTHRLVSVWLSEHGIRDWTYSPATDWISAELEVGTIEKLLNSEFNVYRHVEENVTVTRTLQWSLPVELHPHIEAIHPTNAFFRPRARQASRRQTKRSAVPPIGLGTEGTPTYEQLVNIDRAQMGHMDIPRLEDMPEHPTPSQACNRLATSPLCLRTLYGTLDYTPQAPDRARIGLVNYLGQVNNQSDVAEFLRRYRPEAEHAAYEIETQIVAHGSNQQTPITKEQLAKAPTITALEGNLNAQTIIGIAYPIAVTAYNVGGRAPTSTSPSSEDDHDHDHDHEHDKNEPYLEWLAHVLAQPDSELPQVITTSYADDEESVPYWYAARACAGFAQLGARGVSVLFASGDHGVGADGTCGAGVEGDGKQKQKQKQRFRPEFPASCPYVTAVGSTRGWDPEMVAFDARTTFVSGGGFSNYFAQPAYQRRHVDGYLGGSALMFAGLHNDDDDDDNDGMYNKSGRAYPDLALRGYHYITVWNGTGRIIDGTSASAPAAAAIFALVNDALAAHGRPPLGWLNPWLYSPAVSSAGGFRDVVVGSNPGCNTSGFPATQGWDAATGLGTPWFPALKSLALQHHYRETRPWYMRLLGG